MVAYGEPENGQGEFRIQGVPVTRIVEEFGTPTYVYDASRLESVYRELRGLLRPEIDVFYSLKANPNVSVVRTLGRLGAGAEVSSLVELRTAQRAGISPADTLFLGPGKTEAELAACLDAGLHAIVCESLAELRQLEAAATARGLSSVDVLLRLNPDFPTKGSGLAMGGKPRQFGIDTRLLRAEKERLAALSRVRVRGVHAYMGTRFLAHGDIVHNTREVLGLAADLAADLDIDLDTVDVGGGLGVAYFDNEEDLDVQALARGLNAEADRFLRERPGCRLVLEVGRYLAALCGTYVTRVLYVKESMGSDFVVTDGGTNHHMAAVGTGSFVKRNFPLVALTRYGSPADHEYTVTGPLCTPNDVLGKKVRLPAVAPGDLIGVQRSGAYGPSASPGHFLSHGFPAEVLVHRGTPHLVRARDTAEDLLDRQRLAPL
ncbi:hypothetical protein [Streptomyces sulphureus]|uniref:hypothetical protein n=1 Tax=Streptomyces sulphureus TaxID=47758 RepID=UPI000365217E|nr:hypothetical protein [Streptomyces sulphureus]